MNSVFKKIGVLLAVATDETRFKEIVFVAMVENGTPVSKSRIHGWSVSPSSKNYRHMSSGELEQVVDALIEYYRE